MEPAETRKMYTVVGSDGQTYGPVDIYHLKHWAVKRRIQPGTVLTDENNVAQPAASLEALAAVFYVLAEAPMIFPGPRHRAAEEEPGAPPMNFAGERGDRKNPLGVAVLIILFELFAVGVAWLTTILWRWWR